MVLFTSNNQWLKEGSLVPLTNDALFTLTCWARINTKGVGGGWQPVAGFNEGTDSTKTVIIRCNGATDDDWQFSVQGTAGAAWITFTNAVTEDVWTFLALVRSASNNTTAYYREMTQTTLTSSNSTAASGGFTADRWRIARTPWVGYDETVDLDVVNVKFWQGAALTSEQLLAESYNFRPHFWPSLVVWHPMDRAADRLVDRSGFNLAGVVHDMTQGGAGTPANTATLPNLSWMPIGRRGIELTGSTAPTGSADEHAVSPGLYPGMRLRMTLYAAARGPNENDRLIATHDFDGDAIVNNQPIFVTVTDNLRDYMGAILVQWQYVTGNRAFPFFINNDAMLALRFRRGR